MSSFQGSCGILPVFFYSSAPLSQNHNTLVVMEVKGSARQTANEIDLLMADRIIPMDFIVLTPEQYEQQKDIIGTMVREADREG